MKYKFYTNRRVLRDIFAKYNDTFTAFCELINNSIQAKATKIWIEIKETEFMEDSIEVEEITIKDNGTGVNQSDFKNKIFEIGTEVKTNGMGIGRFSALQIGSKMEIETVSFDPTINKTIKTNFPLHFGNIKEKDLSSKEFDIKHVSLKSKQESYYSVKISNIYDKGDGNISKYNKLSKLLPGNINEAIFLQYPLEILNDHVKFFINGTKLDKNEFVIGEIQQIEREYTDINDQLSQIEFSFINYKTKKTKADTEVFLRVDNNNIKTIGHNFRYSCDIPDNNSWLVYIDSDLFNDNIDIYRSIQISDMSDDSKHLKEFLKKSIDDFFKKKFKEYYDFSRNLKKDCFYPYKNKKASSNSKSIVFNQIAYLIEKEHKILSQKNSIRKVIYNLVDRSINNGDLIPILEEAISLNDDHTKRFKNLLEKTDLENVVCFSEEVAKKNQTLDFLDEIIYGNISKHIKERSQLHKVIEKNLWIFGEQYNEKTTLFSDKSLKNNLKKLRDKFFKYEPTESDENLVKVDSEEIKSITDLFFFHEKIRSDQKREVIIIELKRPSCRISNKELNQIGKYAFEIESSGKFSNEIIFKIYLISSDFTEFAKFETGNIKSNPFLYKSNNNIEQYVIKWSDIFHVNRKKLSYMGNVLSTKDRTIKDVFEKEYQDIDTTNLVSEMSEAL